MMKALSTVAVISHILEPWVQVGGQASVSGFPSSGRAQQPSRSLPGLCL